MADKMTETRLQAIERRLAIDLSPGRIDPADMENLADLKHLLSLVKECKETIEELMRFTRINIPETRKMQLAPYPKGGVEYIGTAFDDLPVAVSARQTLAKLE